MNDSVNILEICDLKVSYNKKVILNSLSCDIKMGIIVGILGEEGSGKSTLINAITRYLDFTGEIFYDGKNLKKYKTHQLSKLSIDFLPQGGSIFRSFTVNEHIELALKLNNEKWKLTYAWSEINLYFPKLFNMKDRLGGTLSGGERIMLSLSCLLVSNCSFIILDEPTSGLSAEVCDSIMPLFRRWKKENKTIVITEHNYDFAIGVCDEILLLKNGGLSKSFTKEITTLPNFVEKYLYNFVSN